MRLIDLQESTISNTPNVPFYDRTYATQKFATLKTQRMSVHDIDTNKKYYFVSRQKDTSVFVAIKIVGIFVNEGFLKYIAVRADDKTKTAIIPASNDLYESLEDFKNNNPIKRFETTHGDIFTYFDRSIQIERNIFDAQNQFLYKYWWNGTQVVNVAIEMLKSLATHSYFILLTDNVDFGKMGIGKWKIAEEKQPEPFKVSYFGHVYGDTYEVRYLNSDTYQDKPLYDNFEDCSYDNFINVVDFEEEQEQEEEFIYIKFVGNVTKSKAKQILKSLEKTFE